MAVKKYTRANHVFKDCGKSIIHFLGINLSKAFSKRTLNQKD